MFASNGEQVVFELFFSTFLTHNPITPSTILTDRDVGQINALRHIFPSSRILLCWWHVLHDWYGKLRTDQHKDAWELLKQFLRQKTQAEHEALWNRVLPMLPGTFVGYINTNWLLGMLLTSSSFPKPTDAPPDPWLPMWAGYYRQGRAILELQDTNMIVERLVVYLELAPLLTFIQLS